MPPTGSSFPFSSTYLPPPPGPPGIYLRFFGGGSDFIAGVGEAARLPPEDSRAALFRGRGALARRGVPGMGAIARFTLQLCFYALYLVGQTLTTASADALARLPAHSGGRMEDKARLCV